MLQTVNIINILSKTLDYVNPRFIEHGKRVADIVYTILKLQNQHEPRRLRDFSIAALLHDVGAYRNAEIDRIMRIETKDVWDHVILGHLFLKYMTPLAYLSPSVLFHHTDFDTLRGVDESHHELAQIIHIADRMDVLSTARIPWDGDCFSKYFAAQKGTMYSGEAIELFHCSNLFSGAAVDGVPPSLFEEEPMSTEEIVSYLRLIVLSIDFRSHQTATHTNDVTCAAETLAKLMGQDEAEARKLFFSAMIHDLGKQGIPLRILESDGGLNHEDMEVMRSHIVLSENILLGDVDEELFRIAVRHHEKLDGSGYPHGLTGEELTRDERLMAVADIMSALFGVRTYKPSLPKSRVMEILGSMAGKGLIDAGMVALVGDGYDTVLREVGESSQETVETYTAIRAEYQKAKDAVQQNGKSGLLSMEL